LIMTRLSTTLRSSGLRSTILGCLALIFGMVILWAVWSSKRGTWTDVLLAVAALAYGLISAPVGIIHWFRRSRGEATDYFEYEVVDEDKGPTRKGVDDRTNYR
jgi:hypothetical protein